jgi:hypothetical protein
MTAMKHTTTQEKHKITMKTKMLTLLTPVLLTLSACTGTAQPSDGQGGGGQGKGKPPTAAEFIAKLDKDGDGRVSQAEFDGPDEHFTQSDTNKDGYISEDEAPSGPPPRQ